MREGRQVVSHRCCRNGCPWREEATRLENKREGNQMYRRNVNKLKREKVQRVVHTSCFIVRLFFLFFNLSLASFARMCENVCVWVGVFVCVGLFPLGVVDSSAGKRESGKKRKECFCFTSLSLHPMRLLPSYLLLRPVSLSSFLLLVHLSLSEFSFTSSPLLPSWLLLLRFIFFSFHLQYPVLSSTHALLLLTLFFLFFSQLYNAVY